ncbi:hypothetical protein J6590_038154 [Homalodisca vitripennis]|nr:hypothetical protein J6590_038154 [Homalodisca vitripennis]
MPHSKESGLPLPFSPPDPRLPVQLFQMTRRGIDEKADIDILVSIRLLSVLVCILNFTKQLISTLRAVKYQSCVPTLRIVQKTSLRTENNRD